jgi:hypothetical protein
MSERWREKNFFKYLREKYLIDAMIDYEVEPNDQTRSVANPARKALEKELRSARAGLTKLQERFGAMAIDYIAGGAPQEDFEKTKEKLRREIEKTAHRIEMRGE